MFVWVVYAGDFFLDCVYKIALYLQFLKWPFKKRNCCLKTGVGLTSQQEMVKFQNPILKSYYKNPD